MKTSCIPHVKRQQLVIIREDYLAICDGNHAAAAILNVFEHWTNSKLDNQEQAEIDNEISSREGLSTEQDVSTWIYKSQVELHTELLGLFGERKIGDALKELKDKGFLESRTNPKFKWDRTIQYRLSVDIVLEAMQDCVIASRKIAQSKAPKRALSLREKAEAIPEVTTETTTGEESAASFSTERAALVLQSPVNYQRQELVMMTSHPIIEAYEKAIGKNIIIRDSEKLSALKAQVAGYTPESAYALTIEKLKTNPEYPYSWMITDLPHYSPKNPIAPAADTSAANDAAWEQARAEIEAERQAVLKANRERRHAELHS